MAHLSLVYAQPVANRPAAARSGDQHGARLIHAASRNRSVAVAKALEHHRLLRSGHDKQDALCTIQRRIGQRHASASLIGARHSHFRTRDSQDRVAGNQRGGMAVRPEAEMDQIHHRRRTGHGLQIAPGNALLPLRILGPPPASGAPVPEITLPCRAGLADVREVAIGIACRRDALVDLEQVHGVPWQLQIGERAQHLPRRTTPLTANVKRPRACTPRGPRPR